MLICGKFLAKDLNSWSAPLFVRFEKLSFSDFWGPLNLLGPSKKSQLLDSWPLSLPLKTRLNLFKIFVLYLLCKAFKTVSKVWKSYDLSVLFVFHNFSQFLVDNKAHQIHDFIYNICQDKFPSLVEKMKYGSFANLFWMWKVVKNCMFYNFYLFGYTLHTRYFLNDLHSTYYVCSTYYF